MIYPAPLRKGDKIAIVSPASHIRHEYVDGACRIIEQWGYEPVVGAHCKGVCGTYSGTVEERLADLTAAFADKSVKAILCSRGGYGVVHLLERIDSSLLSDNPKWFIGFSDISALHAALTTAGVVSLHAPMTKQFAEKGADDECVGIIRSVVEGTLPAYREPWHEFNRPGVAEGQLVGGNLAVLCGLRGSRFDILKGDKILFIEDVNEQVYAVERMLYALRLGGVLGNLRGLIVGRFTDYHNPDGNGESMEQMVRRMVEPYGYPVAFDFPIGHIDRNLPIIEGADVRLDVAASGTSLQFVMR